MRLSIFQILAIFLFIAVYFSTSSPYLYATTGIDPSWGTSLVMAWNQNEIFGQEFIFNYGPLGFLNTLLLPDGVSVWWSVLSQAFIAFNFSFLLALGMKRIGQKWYWAFVIALFILLPWGFIADASFTYFFLLLFWLLYLYSSSKSVLPLILLPILVNLIFFIKLNLSLVAYLLLFGSVVYFMLVKKLSIAKGTLLLICSTLITFLTAKFLHVAIPDYLLSGLKIIGAYQDSMAVKMIKGIELYVLFAFVALSIVLVFFYSWKAFFENPYLLLTVAATFFLSFKQAFTATGHYNIFGFFLLLPPLAILIYLQGRDISPKLVLAILALQLLSTQFIRMSYTGYNIKNYTLFLFPDQVVEDYHASSSKWAFFNVFKYKNPVIYLKKVMDYSYHKNFEQDELPLLADEIVEKIGTSGVDVLPWETSIVFFNQLRYQHRPIIQSYQANSKWLEAKNKDFFWSEESPSFVLATVEDFREQNPFWMDNGSYYALKCNYEVVDSLFLSTGSYLLFKKNAQTRRKEKLLKHAKSTLNKKVLLQEGQYLTAKVHYSLFGRIVRFFFQPPYLRAKVVFLDGQTEEYRIPPPLLEGGVFIEDKVTNWEEFKNFYSNKERKENPIRQIELFSNEAWGFKKDFTYSTWAYEY